MSEPSEHRKHRWLQLFRGFDRDGDGVLTIKDFERMAKEFPDALKVPANDPMRQGFLKQNVDLFESFLKNADANNDRIISKQEWVDWFRQSTKGKSNIDDVGGVIGAMARSMFDGADLNKDGVVDINEYLVMAGLYSHWSSAAELRKNFEILRQGKDGMSRARMEKVMWDMLFNDDKDALSFYVN